MNRVLETAAVEPHDPPRPDPAATAAACPQGAAAAPEIAPRPAQQAAEVERPGSALAHPARSRRWVHLFRVALVLLLIPGTILAGAELATPPVGGAPALVAALDRGHGSQPIPAEGSWRVSQAIVAAEDASFYSNDGIHAAGLGRALWGWLTGVDRGGSTITEQLAKVLYTGGQVTLPDRVAQVALALKLDGHYTKAAILSMYLSAIYFGHGYYGVLAASEGYFGVAPDRLSWAQASLLAGLPQAPSLLDPLQHLALARQRQSYVLGRLVAAGVLTQAQAAVTGAAPLNLR